MKETTKNGRATGLALIFIAILLLAISYNSLNPTLGVIISFFGLAGVLCIWKPDTIGPIVSEFLDRMGRNLEGETTKVQQTQKNSPKAIQISAKDSQVNVNVNSPKNKKSN